MIEDDALNGLCQECADYIKNIYIKICFFPNELKVTFQIGEYIKFLIEGNERDDGVFIGRQGATIQAIRLLIYAYSKGHLEGRPCIVEVNDHRGSKYNQILSPHPYSRHIRR